MKYLFIGLLLVSSHSFAQKTDSTKKVYYYMWTSNHNGNTSWGENDITLSHKPTKLELISTIKGCFGKKDMLRNYIKIVDIVEFSSEDAFYKWKAGFNSSALGYEIYLNSKP